MKRGCTGSCDSSVLEIYRDSDSYKTCVVRQLLLMVTEVLKEEFDRLRKTKYCSQIWCESWKFSMIAFKETHISRSQKTDCAKNQAQDLVVRMEKLQMKLNP